MRTEKLNVASPITGGIPLSIIAYMQYPFETDIVFTLTLNHLGALANCN